MDIDIMSTPRRTPAGKDGVPRMNVLPPTPVSTRKRRGSKDARFQPYTRN